MTIVFTAKFGANVTSLEQAGRFVVESLGDLLANQFKLVFILLVAFGENRLFDHFELIPAFEAAVVFSLGLFVCWSCFGALLRLLFFVSRGGLALFPLASFQEKLELSALDLFALHTVEDLEQGIDFLLQHLNARRRLGKL